MSSVSLVSLSERLLNQNAAQGQDVQASQKSSTPQDNQEALNVAQDQFTPSAQNNRAQTSAQAAGLFSVPQSQLFSPAANSLLQQVPSSPTNQNSAAGQPITPPIQPGQISSAVAPQPTTAPTTDSTYTQQQLQPLNEALVSLGLSQQDIQKLDQIAAISSDFSPAAFTALAYQMEELAQQSSQAATSTASTTAASAGQSGQTSGFAASNSKTLVANS